jgi:hypothetical protein
VTPVTDIPPKQTVNGTAAARVVPGHDMPAGVPPDDAHGADAAGDGERGALVSIHAAAMQAGGDSFPVLKAFQDYLDTERRQARRRLTLLSCFFVFLMIVVVGGFLAAGYKVFGYMKQTQDILLRAALPAAAPAPPPAASAAGAGKEHPPAGIDAELRTLREALSELRDRNAELRAGLAAAVPVTQAAPPATAAVQPPAAATVAQAPAAVPATADVPAKSAAVVAPAPRPPLEFPATPIAPATPEGFADATIHLPAGARDEPPVPWRLFVPTR